MAKDSLLAIPIELRLMIYAPLIAAGDLAITRVSTCTYEESKSVISTHATYRINLGFRDRHEGTTVVPQTSASIQHVEIRISEFFGYNLYELSTLSVSELLAIRCIEGRSMIRKTCRIALVLDYRLDDLVWRHRTGLRHALKELNGFSNVFLKLEHMQPQVDIMLTKPGITLAVLADWRNNQYEIIQQELQPYLGPSVHKHSGEDHGLTFSPSVFERDVESD